MTASGATSTSTTPGPATTLSVAVNPSRLPADGGSYAAIVVSLLDANGNPSLATAATTVYLTSSEQNVGSVPTSITIPAGEGYAVANFTTTVNPGVTTITASGTGLVSAAAVLDTRTPSGFATHLKLVASPSSVLASGTGTLVVQLVDAAGEPARASSSLNVSVTSSDAAIAKPDTGFVIVPAGQNMAAVNFTSYYELGTTIMTASASTLSTAQATVQVVGPNPYTLTVSAMPNQVVEGTTGTIVVWISGTVGHPARAPQDIAVTLTSSNLTVASLTQQVVVIKSGQMYAIGNFTAGSKIGTTAITASAQGLQSGFATVAVSKATDKPAGLRLYFEPNPVLADSGTYSAVTVGIVNSTGSPDVATTSVTVNITSATTSIGTVTGSVTIPKGGEFATAKFSSSYEVGTTILTASAQNLVSAQIAASTYGPIPVAVVIAPASGDIPANGGKYAAVSLTLVDATGNPAVAQVNTVVELSSSLPTVVGVNPLVEFKAGESSLVTTVRTGISPGTSNITASSPGFISSFALVTTILPAPTILGLYAGPIKTINGTEGANDVVTVQLQDVNGLPADASQSTAVTITPSNTTVVKGPIMVTIPPGGDYASVAITTVGAGSANLTATSPGLKSSTALLEVLSNPVALLLTPSAHIVPANTTVSLTLSVTALGEGVANATVHWFTTLGTVSPKSGNTSSTGVAYDVLAPTVGGQATVTAEVTSPIFGTRNTTTTVVFTPVVPPPSPSLASRLAPYLIPIIVVIIVAVAAVAFFFLRRRRRANALKEGETPAEEQPFDELEEGPAPEEGADDTLMLFRGGASLRPAGGPA